MVHWLERSEKEEVDLMEAFDRTESLSLVSWPGAAPVSFFLSLHHLELPCQMSLRLCLDLPWVENEEVIRILSISPHISTESGRKSRGSGYWGTNAGDLRVRLEEGLLWLLGLPLSDHGISGKSLCFILSLHISVVFGKLRFQKQPTWI